MNNNAQLRTKKEMGEQENIKADALVYLKDLN